MRYRNVNILEQKMGAYSIVPIRFEDSESIRKWRNEQMYHLRQKTLLSKEQQEFYFENTVKSLFSAEHPDQYLFSFLENDICIGYGGLVHINYQKKSAEISFIMDTHLEKKFFSKHWSTFLSLIEITAFQNLQLNCIFTWSYKLRPHLYPILESSGFILEREIKDALIEDGKSIDAVIHTKWNAFLKPAGEEDVEKTFEWATDSQIRKFSFQQQIISWETHQNWFSSKSNNEKCCYFILCSNNSNQKIGSIRIDFSVQTGMLSYLIDPDFQKQGWGTALLVLGEKEARIKGIKKLIGEVLPENKASCIIFEKLGYHKEVTPDKIIYHKELKHV